MKHKHRIYLISATLLFSLVALVVLKLIEFDDDSIFGVLYTLFGGSALALADAWKVRARVVDDPEQLRTLSQPPPKPQNPPTGTTPAAGLVLAILVGLSLGNQACSSAVQRGLNTGATLLVKLSDAAAPFYDERDGVCRDRHPPIAEGDATPEQRAERRDLYDACMDPVATARQTRAVLDRLLRTAQAAYDVGGGS